jgi:diguanylate cyclase (GGDEF)-like protein
MSRAQTLVLALLIISFLLGFLCVAVSRSERGSPALWRWGVGTLMYAFGLLITQQRYLPYEFTALVGNSLIAWAPILSVQGVLTYSSRQISARWMYVVLGVLIFILALNVFIWKSALVNFNTPAPFAIVLFVVAAIYLLKSPPADAENAAKFMAFMMLFISTVWLMRVLFLFGFLNLRSSTDTADAIIAFFAIAQIVTGVACTMALFWVEVRRMEASLTKVAYSDALTGLPNRRAVTQSMAQELSRAKRESTPLSLMVIDLDFFKRINDTWGHLAGDDALKHVATLLAANKRGCDVVGRIGGEEFVLLLPGLSPHDAGGLAERLREKLAENPCIATSIGGEPLKLTMSGGVAHYPADGENWDQLFSVADSRCYAAKQGGRNQIKF